MKTFKQVTYNVLTDHQFDSLVKEVYGVDYEVRCVEEAANNGSKLGYAVKKQPLNSWQLESLKDLLRCYPIDLLSDMCNKDIIPPGSYLISVSW